MIRSIAYVAAYDGNPHSGVVRKLLSQGRAFRKAGAAVDLHLFCGEEDVDRLSEMDGVVAVPTGRPPWSPISRLRGLIGTSRHLKTLAEESRYDMVYLRGCVPSPWLWNAVKAPRTCRIVTEHQTIERRELGGSYRLLDRLYGGRVRRELDGVVSVTDEIGGWQRDTYRLDPDRVLTIPNGIECARYTARTEPGPVGDALKVAMVANFRSWHGLPRVLDSLTRYPDTAPPLELHVAGEQSMTTLALPGSVQLHFHGPLDPRQLQSLYGTCHIAFASLAPHHLALTELASLKVREYCAVGIPFVLAAPDPDFPEDGELERFVHRVPADNSPLDLNDVRRFAESAVSIEGHAALMHDYALRTLDWNVKARRLLDWAAELPPRAR